jgi:hypothetical protein
VLQTVSNSTFFVILTLPTFQCIFALPAFVSWSKDAGFRPPAQWIVSPACALKGHEKWRHAARR